MAKTVLFNVKVDDDLKNAFIAAAEADDRNASQVVRDFMRTYIAEREVTPEYKEFMQAKVDRARGEIRQGLGISNEEMKSEFAKLRSSFA